MEFFFIDFLKDFINGVIGEVRRFRERIVFKFFRFEGDSGF